MTANQSIISSHSTNTAPDEDLLFRRLSNAHGRVSYNMTNDYMFPIQQQGPARADLFPASPQRDRSSFR